MLAAAEQAAIAAGGQLIGQIGSNVLTDVKKGIKRKAQDLTSWGEKLVEREVEDVVDWLMRGNTKRLRKNNQPRWGEFHEKKYGTDADGNPSEMGSSGLQYTTENPAPEMVNEPLPENDIDEGYISRLRNNRGSFTNNQRSANMPYRRRGRRRRRSRKGTITKRGVKQILARSVATAGSKVTVNIQSIGSVYGDYRAKGMGIFPFHWSYPSNGDLNQFLLAAVNSNPAPNAGIGTGIDSFPRAQVGFWTKSTEVEILLHNPLTEGYFANIWFIKNKNFFAGSATFDIANTSVPYNHITKVYSFTNSSLGPLYTWNNQWAAQSDFAETQTFERDFCTYPSKYKFWRELFDIKKKWKTFFTPGETKVLKVKLPGIHFNRLDYDTDITTGNVKYLQDLTHFLMFELRGVPTHQDDGDDNEAFRYTIAPCRTAMEYTVRYSTVVGQLNGKDVVWDHDQFNYAAVTAAQSLIPEVQSTVRSV